jgi:hypothetical protein
MAKRLGLYLARVSGTKVLPKEPVPPVIRMDELFSMFGGLPSIFCGIHAALVTIS